MKRIGVDYGRRRIGVATTDDSGSHVRGLCVIDRQREPDAITALNNIITREQARQIVFGLPLDADDRETAMAVEVKEFARALAQQCALPQFFIDESNSSKQAQVMLRSRKKKQRRNKSLIDVAAACIILDSFIREQSFEAVIA